MAALLYNFIHLFEKSAEDRTVAVYPWVQQGQAPMSERAQQDE